ncbi:MerR family transcriptional regulator [Gordonia terrae]|uniref:MerR family transcriptional regulator n=1 Tax=Gordonia hongkongensis TaxID=1701090 RepID=UPI0022B3DA24|nr:MerR family transcriptional regulator [Gordonia terrae]
MMTIGAFAQSTGLTVKALHLYDERGILEPADVDEASGYRRYSTSQVRQASSIAVLRAMGLPLDEVKRWLEEPDRRESILSQYRADVVREREREDAIWEEGNTVLAEYDVVRPLFERQAPARPWLAVTAPVATAGEGAEAQQHFEAAVEVAHHAAITATGPFWTAFRINDCDELEMLLAIGLDREVPHEIDLGAHVLTGVLPARTERYVLVDPGFAMTTEIAAPHPGVVSLAEALPDEPLDTIRQTIVAGAEGSQAIELVLDAPTTAQLGA